MILFGFATGAVTRFFPLLGLATGALFAVGARVEIGVRPEMRARFEVGARFEIGVRPEVRARFEVGAGFARGLLLLFMGVFQMDCRW